MAANEIPLDDYSVESGSAPLSLRVLLKLVKSANGLARRKNGTLNRRLADLLEHKVPASKKPDHGVTSQDIVIDSETGVWVRVFLPSGSSTEQSGSMGKNPTGEKKPIIFYFHGGGFAVLCANFVLYDVFCRRLCRRCQAIVISVNYRRAPEYRYPTAYEDSFSALKWLQAKGQGYLPPDADSSHCFLMGDSAGANIVHHVGYRAATEDLSPVKIVGHALLYPFFGGEERTPAELRLVNGPLVSTSNSDWHWKAYLPQGANRDHPASNVFGPNAPDLSSVPLPPSVVVVGEFDPLKDWQLRYLQGLKKAGKEAQLLYYKGGVHAFHIFNRYKKSSQVLSDLKDFIKSHC